LPIEQLNKLCSLGYHCSIHTNKFSHPKEKGSIPLKHHNKKNISYGAKTQKLNIIWTNAMKASELIDL